MLYCQVSLGLGSDPFVGGNYDYIQSVGFGLSIGQE
jgi:hypothetical protein